MKKYLLGLTAAALLVGFFLLGNLLFFRPLSLDAFYARSFIKLMLHKPQLLTSLHFLEQFGITFHQSQLDDQSEAKNDEMLVDMRKITADLREYDQSDFSQDDKNNYESLERFLVDSIEGGDRWRHHNYPLNQLFGVQNEFPSFMESMHQVGSESEARDYIARLSKVGVQFQQVMEGLRIREAKGIIPPRFVIVKVLDEMRSFISASPEQNMLYTSFEQKLKDAGIKAEEQRSLLDSARDEIKKSVYPAYQVFIDYYAALERKATDDDGVWKFPDGEAYYAFALRRETSTDLDADKIHEIGLAEVARIEAEMKSILGSLGMDTSKTLGELMKSLSQDERYFYPDSAEGRSQILADYKKILGEADVRMADYFDLKPKASLEVKRIPEFKEKTAPGAYYNSPAIDGSRPGTFYANLYDIKATAKFDMRTLAYHEGIPGHHFQISIAQENEHLPFFRKILPFTAYVEGWALYAERLAWEAGLQKDPLDNLGRLQAEIFRSIRLVVDTGIHKKRWTRQQAIDYMSAHTGMADSDVVAEIERYIVDPGQACAYKVGMLKILELRQRAQDALGDKFSLREFHGVILRDGALPLSLVERNIIAWVTKKKNEALAKI